MKYYSLPTQGWLLTTPKKKFLKTLKEKKKMLSNSIFFFSYNFFSYIKRKCITLFFRIQKL